MSNQSLKYTEPWTEQEDQKLREQYPTHPHLQSLCTEMHRSYKLLAKRAQELGITRVKQPNIYQKYDFARAMETGNWPPLSVTGGDIYSYGILK